MKKFKMTLFAAIACVGVILSASTPTAAVTVKAANNGINHWTGETFDVYTSSTIKDYTSDNKMPKHMFDGNTSTFWCSAWVNESVPACKEYVLFDFKDIVKISSVTLTALQGGVMFPDGFEFCWSTSGEVEIPIEGGSYDDYRSPRKGINVFTFQEPVVARYLKMNIHSRTPDENGIHLVCIAEASVDFSPASESEKQAATEIDGATIRPLVINDPKIEYSLTTSSFLDDDGKWIPEHLTDGNLSTQWCSEWVSTSNEEDEIYVNMAFGDPKKVTGVILSSQGVCFPKDFIFQYSFDMEHWLDIAGTSYTDFSPEGEQDLVFAFPTPQVATAIRLKVTKKTADPSGNYLVQLADVDVRGFEPTEEEETAANQAFIEEVGTLPPPKEKPIPIPATPEFFEESGCNSVLGGGSAVLGLSCLGLSFLKILKTEKKHEEDQ